MTTEVDNNQLTPLSPEEAEYFGWGEPGKPTPIILVSRTPAGRRMIPTRERLPNGTYWYGFIETDEPGFLSPDLESWERLTNELSPTRGKLM